MLSNLLKQPLQKSTCEEATTFETTHEILQ